MPRKKKAVEATPVIAYNFRSVEATPVIAYNFRSAATTTSDRSAASVEGKYSVAIATGHEGRAKAAKGSAIVLVHRDPVSGAIRHIRAAVAGREVKPDVWYALDERGEFVEV